MRDQKWRAPHPKARRFLEGKTIARPGRSPGAARMKCRLEVFELSGRRVWLADNSVTSDMHGGMQTQWDLRDDAGRRVPRGIYLYRATVETPDGMYSSQTKKLAVTAQ